ncbi:MAG: deoxyribodipyrimidine photo-lyase, partial [Flavobacteriaceae bacterium]|nr:deoxyribodipyrimidine photo-lyase [Flavobacteriaceae bacterium]
MQKKQDTSLVWFRNDLRIHDNVSLANAINSNSRVIALYCFDPRLFEVDQFGFKKTEKYRVKFLIETVTDLKNNLSQLNIPLFIYTIKPENCIPDLVENYQINHIFLQEEWMQEEVDVFNKVKEKLPEHIQISTSYNQFLYHPKDIPFNIEQLPKVFTEFRKACEKQSNIRPETTLSTEKVNEDT